jgi:predicted transcriptional regulator
MASEKIDESILEKLLKDNKIATLSELKTALNTNSTMTVFRKLKELEYISSYSHRGKYYSLFDIADFDHYGRWSHQSVWFSRYGNLIETAKDLIDHSTAGYSVKEMESILHVEVKHTLLNLYKKQRVEREKFDKVYVYFAIDKKRFKNQRLIRKDKVADIHFDLTCEIDKHSHELKAAIILFFSLLDEKQRRLYAGLESFKIGHGGDKRIADLLGLDAHTVAKGRVELFTDNVEIERTRKKGAGRKPVEKKRQKSSKKLKD